MSSSDRKKAGHFDLYNAIRDCGPVIDGARLALLHALASRTIRSSRRSPDTPHLSAIRGSPRSHFAVRPSNWSRKA